MVGLLNWGSGAVGGGGAAGQERAVGCDVEEAHGWLVLSEWLRQVGRKGGGGRWVEQMGKESPRGMG